MTLPISARWHLLASSSCQKLTSLPALRGLCVQASRFAYQRHRS
ncbi:hypothetical protein HMPREF9069_00638 [Atopobium sp. oral taxon 810 str. F0209]|nr:hypothetical protein HMPREF9069_00638 [Atopobium sp. oral taxon 810 str. F0209]